MKIRQVVRKREAGDIKVIESVEGEEGRLAGCLCVTGKCKRLVTQAEAAKWVDFTYPNENQKLNARVEQLKKAFNCPMAQQIYEACVAGELASPVTRCPAYVRGE